MPAHPILEHESSHVSTRIRISRAILAAALLLAGAWLFYIGDPQDLDWILAAFAALFSAIVLVPSVRNILEQIVDRLRSPSPRTALATALAIWLVSGTYLILSGWHQGWDLAPRLHDEYSYLLQMQMLAHGRLWMPAHPLADFFESFHIFSTPVYGSLYFPGTALLFLPSIWLHLPVWLMPVLVSAGAVALIYRITTTLIDGAAGLLSAVMMLALSEFRAASVTVMSQPAMLLLALAAFWSFLRWRETRRIRWAALVGLFGGWLAITRPVDAVGYLAPVGLIMLLDLRGRPARQWFAALGAVTLCAAPLISLQLIQNVGVTGCWYAAPHSRYTRLDMPQMVYGFPRFDPTARPASSLVQKQLYYKEFMVPVIQAHRIENLPRVWLDTKLPRTLRTAVPALALTLLLPLGLLRLNRPRGAMLVVLPLFIALYAPFPYLLGYYPLMAAPPAIVAILLGADGLAAGRRTARLVLSTLIGALCILSLPELGGVGREESAPALRKIDRALATQVRPPAVVLFRFARGCSYHTEPVYNIDTAWPDDAPIIRAHDLGPQKNQTLIDYYARLQPQRIIYIYDRGSETLEELGSAAALAKSR